MCGIAGYVGRRAAVPVVLEGLGRLEYRGYDSAGLVTLRAGALVVHKIVGRVARLLETLPDMGDGPVGLGHTRWATHGEPSVANAHPHLDADRRIALVHNGIIENARALRAELEADGVAFASGTDTEVLVHLIARAGTEDLERGVREALGRVEGSYGIAVVSAAAPGQIVLARHRSPVVIGIGDGEHFVASDVAAFAPYTQRVVYLEDRELAVVEADGLQTSGLDAAPHARRTATLTETPAAYEIGSFSHYMRKEIFEQPGAIRCLLEDRLDTCHGRVRLEDCLPASAARRAPSRVVLFGCGSAYYAGLAGALVLERLSGIPAEAHAASELRYRSQAIDPDALYLAISQSGETADTLQAIEAIRRGGADVVALVNVPDSTIARVASHVIALRSGPEQSVAATKSFTSMFVALVLVGLSIGREPPGSGRSRAQVIGALADLPARLEDALETEAQMAAIAARWCGVTSAFFIGRLLGYPLALEGAQKLKEISYIHAEAYPCGELKHGPLALVHPGLPTFAIVPDDELFAKNLATLEEIRARRGPVIALGHSIELKAVADEAVIVAKSDPVLDPLLGLVALQLLAYHSAVALGLDVDRPRNLAKSVTVE